MNIKMSIKLLGAVLLLGIGANSFAQVITIGAGGTTSGTINPVTAGATNVNGSPQAQRQQILYTKAQLNAAGITGPKLLDSIAWQIQTAPNKSIKNYTIKAKLCGYTNVSNVTLDTLGFTQLVSLPTFQPTITPSTFYWVAFSTPLYWNGVDNILFNICSDTASGSASGKVYLTSSTAYQTRYAIALQPICGSLSGVTFFSNSALTSFPNIQMSFRAAPACSGTPASLSVIPIGPLTNCANEQQYLQISNLPNTPSNLQWQKSDNGGAWTDITTGGNGAGYNAIFSGAVNNTTYRIKAYCGVDTTTSNTVVLNSLYPAIYAVLPYHQDFENWLSKCNTTDIPDSSWVNVNISGPFSWRREDQGASAGWTLPDATPQYYYPFGSSGNHSARIETSKGSSIGSLLLNLNASSSTNGLELRFDYFNKTTQASVLKIYYSSNAGATYSLLTTYSQQGVNSAWTPQVVQIPSNSATTVIKFEATGGGNQSGDFDLGIDNVWVYPTCTGTPEAGSVDTASTCLNSGLQLKLDGASTGAGLHWIWQRTTTGIAWDSIPGGQIEHPTVTLTGPTWFRCILVCTATGLSDTTAPRLITPYSFYHCYCSSNSLTPNPSINIGNVKLRNTTGTSYLIDNGNPLPVQNNVACVQHYSDFTNLPAADLYTNNTYSMKLSFIERYGPPNNPTMPFTTNDVYIDLNRNGIYEPSELVWHHFNPSVISPAVAADSGTFTIPLANTVAGITGMRIISNSTLDSNNSTTNSWAPCGTYALGETEDYLVHLWIAPCNNGSTAGTVAISDTLACPGYPFTLTNAGYDTTASMIDRIWQQSPDGTAWTDISGSDNMDAFQQDFTTDMWYRIKSTCSAGGTDAYSNLVQIKKYVSCYCVSYADGGFAGAQDSSDIGGFVLGSINFPLVGGHLNNPNAVREYTNRTSSMSPASFYVDSTYNFHIDHTILRNDHADARITMFIDYNGNGTYDVPQELVYTGTSTATSWQKNGTITIPSTAALNTTTGLRVIINNNATANTQSDDACGVYTSGETEDYIVTFKAKHNDTSTAIANVNGLAKSIQLFPNPTTGLVTIRYQGATTDNGIVRIEGVAGNLIEQKELGKMKNGSNFTVDLSKYAKGVYFIILDTDLGKATGKVILQ